MLCGKTFCGIKISCIKIGCIKIAYFMHDTGLYSLDSLLVSFSEPHTKRFALVSLRRVAFKNRKRRSRGYEVALCGS